MLYDPRHDDRVWYERAEAAKRTLLRLESTPPERIASDLDECNRSAIWSEHEHEEPAGVVGSGGAQSAPARYQMPGSLPDFPRQQRRSSA
jgi:hypothetical protein